MHKEVVLSHSVKEKTISLRTNVIGEEGLSMTTAVC